jgi:tetratricopeptide (TPR) repeat protein
MMTSRPKPLLTAPALARALLAALALLSAAPGALAVGVNVFPESALVPPSKSSVAQDELRRGVEALQKGDLNAATAAFNESAKLDPKIYAPLLGLAEVSLRRNQPKEAEGFIQRALKLAPKSAELQTAAGRVAFANRQLPLAEERLKRAVAIDPNFFSAQIDLGDLYLDTLRKPRDAAEYYRAASKIDPNHAGAHYGLGRALAGLGDTVGALAEFETAAKLAPKNPLPVQAAGEMELALDRHDKALATFDQALKIQPNFVPAMLGKGDAYLAKRDSANALTAYRAAASAAPKLAGPQMKLGMLLQQLQRPEEAETAYLAAVAIDQNLAVAYNNLAWMAAERRTKLDDALKWAQRAVKLAPSQKQFLDTLGWVQRQRGEVDQALATLEKAAKMQPPLGSVLVHLGVVYEDKGRAKDALAAYQQALALKQPSPEARFAEKRVEALEKK